jgi:pimeloyl-ACP methyl ester carboxylesterase
MQAPLGGSQGPEVLIRIQSLGAAPGPLSLLYPSGLADAWAPFIGTLGGDPSWIVTIGDKPGSVGEISPHAARAVVAAFLRSSAIGGQPGLTGEQRDALVDSVIAVLGAPLGLADWLKNKLTNVALPRRGSFTDLCSAQVGDILRYQARGATLREFIGERARQTGASVILAHSLGGVAAVDWLIGGPRGIDTLVTVGSQAPLFYEIDALSSLAWRQPLPGHFPRWLNFYDPRDFLAYCGSEIFPGVAIDVRVDNGQPFPDSHGAYWQNDHEMWPEINRFLR